MALFPDINLEPTAPPVPHEQLTPSSQDLANSQAALATRTEDQYKGLLNRGISDEFMFNPDSFANSESAKGMMVNPGMVRAISSLSQKKHGREIGSLKFDNFMKAKNLQISGSIFGFQERMNAEQMIKMKSMQEAAAEANAVAARSAVISSITQSVGAIAGTAFFGPAGGAAGGMAGKGLADAATGGAAYKGSPQMNTNQQPSDDLAMNTQNSGFDYFNASRARG